MYKSITNYVGNQMLDKKNRLGLDIGRRIPLEKFRK